MARTIVENGKTLRLTGLTDRKFGVELELFATRSDPSDRQAIIRALTAAGISVQSEYYNHTTRSHWKIVDDMSVETPNGRRGLELVSPPLSGEAGLLEVEKVCTALASIGAWVSRSCGMHIHHDAADLTIENIRDLAWLTSRFAPVFDGLVPESRRAGHNNFCKPWTESDLVALSRISSLYDLRDRFEAGSSLRYRTLNLCSLARHGTVEFRQHSGTVDAEKIVAWVMLTQGLVEKAASGTVRVKRAQLKANGDGLDNLIRAAGLRTCKPHGQVVDATCTTRARVAARYLAERARHFAVIVMADRSIERTRAARAAAIPAPTAEALVAQAVATAQTAPTTA